jgi:hypothetical protein
MPVYSVVSPYLVDLNASDLTSAVKQFAKLYYQMKINEIIIKDHVRHYRANLKYFNNNGKGRVAINMFPYMLPMAFTPATQHISQVILPQQGYLDSKAGQMTYSPAAMITHTTKFNTNDNDSDKTFVMSPLSPLGGFGFFPRLF